MRRRTDSLQGNPDVSRCRGGPGMWCMSPSRAADVILMTWFMKTDHWRSLGGAGGGQAAGRETPVLLPHSEPSPAGTQQRNYRDCTCSGAHGHAHGCTSSQQGQRAPQWLVNQLLLVGGGLLGFRWHTTASLAWWHHCITCNITLVHP